MDFVEHGLYILNPSRIKRGSLLTNRKELGGYFFYCQNKAYNAD